MCYLKALELEPDNESYRGNLAIAEDKLRADPSQPPVNPFTGLGKMSEECLGFILFLSFRYSFCFIKG